MSFWFEQHTADVTVAARSDSLGGVFAELARAVTHVMTEDTVREVSSHEIHVVAESLEALLFDFLAHLIFLLDTEALFVSSAQLQVTRQGADWVVSGIVRGDVASAYDHAGDVKAPTYNRL